MGTCKLYDLRQFSEGPYRAYLVCLSVESIVEYIEDIEENEILQGQGRIVVDQLLVTGDRKSRFFTLTFSDGRLDRASAHRIEAMESFKRRTSEVLRAYPDILSYSLLPKRSREAILQGGYV